MVQHLYSACKEILKKISQWFTLPFLSVISPSFPLHSANVQGSNFSNYRLQTKLREGNVFTPVCDSVHRGVGVYPSMQWAMGCTSSRQIPLGRHPLRQTPLPLRWPLKRAVRILLECILVQDLIEGTLRGKSSKSASYPNIKKAHFQHLYDITCMHIILFKAWYWKFS